MNIVLIIIDSLCQDHLGAYGNEWIHTPNLDAFAKEAVTFTRCYAEALPTIPARRAINTGKRCFPYRSHYFFKGNLVTIPGWSAIPEGQVTLSEVLWKHGYRTGLVADTFHLFDPSMNFHRGFESWIYVRGHENDLYKSGPPISKAEMFRYLPESAKEHEDLIIFLTQYLQNVSDWKSEEDCHSAKLFRTSAQWLMDNHDAEKIFLLVDSFSPHEPWNTPAHYRKLYDSEEDVANVICSPYFNWEGQLIPKELKRLQANYAGNVTMFDRWFGYFLETLRLSGRLDETIVALISDHGHSLGYPRDKGFVGKQGYPMTRSVADLVMMIRHPSGAAAGKICDKLIYNYDLPITLLHLADIETAEGMEGENFWPAVMDESLSVREYVTIGWGPAITVINDKWWYNADIWGEAPLLYFIREDQKLENNVSSKHPEICNEMLGLALKDAGGEVTEAMELSKSRPGCGPSAMITEPYRTAHILARFKRREK